MLLSLTWSLSACGGASREGDEGDDSLPDPLGSLTSIWGSGAGDIWAVGPRGSIAHYDGSEWSPFESPTSSDLTGVSGTGPDDVWAVGREVVLRFDGEGWSVVLSDMDELLLSAWSGAHGELWAAGTLLGRSCGVIRRWNGVDWERAVSGDGQTLWTVWGDGQGSVWTGGTGSHGDAFLARKEGTEFSEVAFPGSPPRGLWGLSSHDIWTVSREGTPQHFDGTAWRARGRDDVHLLDVSGTATDDVWAVGLEGVALHWDGRSWTDVAVPTRSSLLGVWAVAPDDVWMIGEGGTPLHWNGASVNAAGR